MEKKIEDSRRWKDLSCTWIDRINFVEITILPKVIDRFNTISIKIIMIFFRELQKTIQNSYGSTKVLEQLKGS
jgi:hypothetical protein